MIKYTRYFRKCGFQPGMVLFMAFLIFLMASCSTSAFFYAPYKELKQYPDTSIYGFEEIGFRSGKRMLNGWFLKPKQGPVIGTVLQLHGNGANISYQYQFAKPLVQAGFQVMVFDYEGYGKSEGKPSQERVLNNGISALDYIHSRPDVKGTKLILFGQSLGGHLSCVVAAKEQKRIDALVIEGAFTGHERMAVYVSGKRGAPAWLARLLVPTKYEGIEYIDEVTIPKLIIHSTEDATCPFFMGKELYEAAAAPKEFWEVKGYHIQSANLYPEEFVERFKKLIR